MLREIYLKDNWTLYGLRPGDSCMLVGETQIRLLSDQCICRRLLRTWTEISN